MEDTIEADGSFLSGSYAISIFTVMDEMEDLVLGGYSEELVND